MLWPIKESLFSISRTLYIVPYVEQGRRPHTHRNQLKVGLSLIEAEEVSLSVGYSGVPVQARGLRPYFKEFLSWVL